MAVLPTIDGVTSVLSLILATLASLRAASRLERRICNNGSIGLMNGPPILGPRRVPVADRLEDGDRINSEEGEDDSMIEASPLWEHTEAFRRAVILGLMLDDASDSVYSAIFSDITRNEGTSIGVRGGSDEDLAIAAAVEAGLLLPSSTRGGGSGTRHRGGGMMRTKVEDSNSNNPISRMSSWFVRELSAPLAAIPAWYGMVCSYARVKKEDRLRKSLWCLLTPWERLRFSLTGRSTGKVYDPSTLDFDASISAVAKVPCPTSGYGADPSSAASKTVRVKAFAPKTFRDLRNKCFRVSEREYARSILNAMNGAASAGSLSENGDAGVSINNDDATISNLLREIVTGRTKGRIRPRKGMQTTLPYISFQSNSKGAARAGTFFFFTSDGAYMIKTVKREEATAFLEMLPEYHRFMSEDVNGRNSLLTRIFGMYSVRFPPPSEEADAPPGGDARWDGGYFSSSHEHKSLDDLADDERVYLVMHSVFPPEASAFLTERFDLKGSTVGRECSLEERSSKGANAVLKDLDLMREVEEELHGRADEARDASVRKEQRPRYGICVGSRSRTRLMAQLERDVDLLHRCNVLDYSLLVGVADMESSNRSVKPIAYSRRVPKCLQDFFGWMDFPVPYFGAGSTAVDGGPLSSMRGTRRGKHVMYYLGVIDFLQPWTVKKRLERDLKGLAGYDKSAISCVAPWDYAERFLKFVNSHVT